jgi:hypothetical protein
MLQTYNTTCQQQNPLRGHHDLWQTSENQTAVCSTTSSVHGKGLHAVAVCVDLLLQVCH